MRRGLIKTGENCSSHHTALLSQVQQKGEEPHQGFTWCGSAELHLVHLGPALLPRLVSAGGGLTLREEEFLQPLYLRLEPHAQHFVCFVQYHILHRICTHTGRASKTWAGGRAACQLEHLRRSPLKKAGGFFPVGLARGRAM